MTDAELDLKSEIDRLREELRQAKLVEIAVDESFRKVQQELLEAKIAQRYAESELKKTSAAIEGMVSRMRERTDDRIFVFGSNLAGRHGLGAALEARERWGAVYGQGVGRQGQSYAIPTKDEQLVTLPLAEIARHVRDFLDFATSSHPELRFRVTRIGCGLAGYTEAEIKPLFVNAPPNCEFEWTT